MILTVLIAYAAAATLGAFAVVSIYRALRLEAKGRLVDSQGDDASAVFYIYYIAFGSAVGLALWAWALEGAFK